MKKLIFTLLMALLLPVPSQSAVIALHETTANLGGAFGNDFKLTMFENWVNQGLMNAELYGFFGSGTDGTYGLSLMNNTATFAPQSGYTGGFSIIANQPYAYLSAANVLLLTPANTKTLTNTTIDTAGTGNDITVPLNGLLDDSITTPADTDDIIYRRTQKALTLTDIYCNAQGGGTITLTLQECDNATCASPSTIEGAITCDADGAEDDGTLTDGAIAAGAWIKVLFSAPTGTVSTLAWSVDGVQVW